MRRRWRWRFKSRRVRRHLIFMIRRMTRSTPGTVVAKHKSAFDDAFDKGFK